MGFCDMTNEVNRLRGYAVLVIDMLNDYLLPDGAVYCAEGRKIIPKISSLATFVRDNGGFVFYLNTELYPSDLLSKKWGVHASPGSFGAEVVKELTPELGDTIISKKFYNGFHETDLHEKLTKKHTRYVLLTGIHTHVCVMLTGVGAFERGYRVIAFEDCMTTGYKANHDSRLQFFFFLGSHIGSLEQSENWMRTIATSHD
tara:strand:- start:2933 stop:3535 length:603 start_codon:yes stop_codon:yes gene_type:complete